MLRQTRMCVVAGVALACAVAGPLDAQEAEGGDEVTMRYGLPDVDSGARNRVAFRLFVYYHYMSRLGGVPFDAILGCSADRGEPCFDGGDWESDCRLWRCRTENEKTRFMDALVELAEEYPHSPEAMGHAVYAAVRLNRTASVEGLLDACEPTDAWWCELLRGYLLHETRRSGEAVAPIERGLAAAPDEMRCRLEDMERLLPSEVREAYDEIPCDERGDVHEYIWWLADPFWMEPGNERRVEHLMRGFSVPFHESRLHASRSPGRRHSDWHDMELIRRGYWDSWGPRTGTRRGDPEANAWTSRRGAFNHFVPDALDLSGLTSDLRFRLEGELDDEGWTRPAGPVLAAPAQMARFLDGDQMSVALASDLGAVSFEPPWATELEPVPGADTTAVTGPDSTDAVADSAAVPSRGPLPAPAPDARADGRPVRGDEARVVAPGQAWFVTSEGPGHVAHVDPVPIRERVTFSVAVPNLPQVVGLEAFSPAASARHRAVAMPLAGDGPELSDLLLYRPFGPDLPETRIRAVALMLGTLEVRSDDLVGLYWEGYDLPTDEPIGVAVSISDIEVGLLGRLGGLIGLGAEGRSATVEWTEPPLDDGDLRRAITLDVAGLDTGAHELTVELTLPDGTVLSRALSFEVIEPPDGR